MTFVVDSSVLIDHLRGHAGARGVIRQAIEDGSPLAASVMAKVEVLAGMRASEQEATRTLLGMLEWIEVDDALAERAGELANQFLRTHPGVDSVDFVIAATVERQGARLLTQNVKHFPMFPGLEAPY